MPKQYEVCFRCGGEGKIVNPSIDGHGLSAEDFAEDPDFEEAYFAGHYDITCTECDGLRVIDITPDPNHPDNCDECGIRMHKTTYKEYPGADGYQTDYSCRNSYCPEPPPLEEPPREERA